MSIPSPPLSRRRPTSQLSPWAVNSRHLLLLPGTSRCHLCLNQWGEGSRKIQAALSPGGTMPSARECTGSHQDRCGWGRCPSALWDATKPRGSVGKRPWMNICFVKDELCSFVARTKGSSHSPVLEPFKHKSTYFSGVYLREVCISDPPGVVPQRRQLSQSLWHQLDRDGRRNADGERGAKRPGVRVVLGLAPRGWVSEWGFLMLPTVPAARGKTGTSWCTQVLGTETSQP